MSGGGSTERSMGVIQPRSTWTKQRPTIGSVITRSSRTIRNYKAQTKRIRAKFQSTEHSREYQRNWVAHRRATDPHYKLYGSLCARVSMLLGRRNKRRGTVELLGCSVEEFKANLERQWEPGMSWENYGKGAGKWNLDHIRPCASFNLLDPAQASQCFHHSNMRPCWHVENNSKKSLHEGKHWFRGGHGRYSDSICSSPQQA